MLHQPKLLMPVLILLVYYNRPLLVRNALASVERSITKYPDLEWHMAVLDDGSDIPAEPVVREVMKDYLDHISFYRNDISFREKLEVGITVGRLANNAIRAREESICVTLCDDDELFEDYLYSISRFFGRRKDIRYCYSNILLYNPLVQTYKDVNVEVVSKLGSYNQWSKPINCYGKIDGSQVAFRTSCMKEDGIWYLGSTIHPTRKENPFLVNLDGNLFQKFYSRYGSAQYSDLIAQYKGVHEYQMVFLKEHKLKNNEDLINYHKRTIELSGVLF
jgi:hypothetical protein